MYFSDTVSYNNLIMLFNCLSLLVNYNCLKITERFDRIDIEMGQ